VKISWINHPDGCWMDPLITHMEESGHQVVKDHIDESFDILFGASISVQENIYRAHMAFPNVPMVNYNWDVYEWAYNSWPSQIFPYNLNLYQELLRLSKYVACPSKSVVYRNSEFFNIPESQSPIVKSFARQLYISPEQVRDDRFVYMPLRQIPDRNRGWFERACKELNVPYRLSDKSLSEADYQDTIASCSFIVCPWYEASTGGLSLFEAASVGKPVLFSDSKYMGANDYMGDYATKFKHDSYEDLKLKISNMWNNPSTVDLPVNLLDEFKPAAMAEGLIEVFNKCL